MGSTPPSKVSRCASGPCWPRSYDAVATAAGAQAAGTVLPRMGMAVLTRTGLHEAGIRYVHVVRDIRSMVAAGQGGGEGPAIAARRWDTQNRMFRQRWGGDPDRYRMVRYEDLLADPDGTVRDVGCFLGAEGTPAAVPLPVEDPSEPLDAATRAAVTAEAAEGLYDFGYDPPAGSPRRLVRAVARRADGVLQKGRRAAVAATDRAWVLRAPAPGRSARRDDDLAPAWCNVCRWAGEAFSGVPHAESADCPRCGTIARQRFHLHGLGLEPATGGRRVLETAPRSAGQYARAMRHWYDYAVLDPSPGSGPLGHLADITNRPDGSVDRLLTAHDLQTVRDPDAVLAEFARVLAPGGVLLLQVPVLSGTTTAIEVADTAAPGTARWSFGVDVHERVAAAGYATDLLVTEELADLVAADPSTWATAPGSGEVDVESLLSGLADASTGRCGRSPHRPSGRLAAARPLRDHPWPPPCRGDAVMFTVQGMPRSGTTLLAQCLNAHPALVVPDETDFMVPAAHAFCLIDDPEVGRRYLADLVTATARFEVTLGRWLTPERVAAEIAEAPYRFDALIASLYEASPPRREPPSRATSHPTTWPRARSWATPASSPVRCARCTWCGTPATSWSRWLDWDG